MPACFTCKEEMQLDTSSTYIAWIGSIDGKNHAGTFVHQGECHRRIKQSYPGYLFMSLPWYNVPLAIRRELFGHDFIWPPQPRSGGKKIGSYIVSPIFNRSGQKQIKKHRRLQKQQGWLSLRFSVLKRDGYSCCLCGKHANGREHVRLEVDHIIPKSKGGTNEITNLQTLCFSCNRGKGVQTL